METAIPEGFKQMASALPGVDAAALISALETEPEVSVKLNRRMVRRLTGREFLTAGEAGDLLGYAGLEPVPWCRSGFYLPERPQFTLNPLLHAGLFYVQDASSMVYETMLGEHLGDMPPGLALDLCAAPGGKSTSMLNALPDGWHLVANEFTPNRAPALLENLTKWGYPDVTVTNSATGRLATGGPLFSIVAVDAPCSGEGMMRKEETARAQWSPGLVKQCAALQREILSDAVEALLPGGLLVFSTCTFNTTENDDNVAWLQEYHGLELLEQPRRFMPHITRGEGLFAAIFRKPGAFAPARNAGKRLQKLLAGCRALTPPEFHRDDPGLPTVDVDLNTALDYLRRMAVTLPPENPRGPLCVTYKNVRLGTVKNLGNRANNQYPKEWRIRNL